MTPQSYYHIRKKKNTKVGRARFTFFSTIVKTSECKNWVNLLLRGVHLFIFELPYLVTAPGNLPKLELTTTGGKTSISSPEEQMYTFYF